LGRARSEYEESPEFFGNGGYLEALVEMYISEKTKNKNLRREIERIRSKYVDLKNQITALLRGEVRGLHKDMIRISQNFGVTAKNILSKMERLYGKAEKEKKEETREYILEDYKKDLRTVRQNCKTLADNLKSIVIGQDSHIDELVTFLKAHFSGLSEDKPTAIFLHGPTGVGKTYTLENLNKFLFKSIKYEPPLFWVNGADYAQEHYVSNLVGSPQGYVGYGERGRLISHIIDNPEFSILLFDEIEKAHPRLHTFLLNLLDKGFVFSGKGEKYECRHYIIGFTSNIGEQDFSRKKEIGINKPDKATRRKDRERFILEKLMDEFPPEFRGRISAFLHYNELTHDQINNILGIEIGKLNNRALLSYGRRIIVTEKAQEKLLDIALSIASYGARGVKDTVKKYIESNTKVIDILESNNSVVIDESDSDLVYEPVYAPPLLSRRSKRGSK